jgi:hypothetical protein
MEAARQGLGRTSKDDLPFPTDAAALVFGVLIFCVAALALNTRFLNDPDTYWHIATGKWMLANDAFPRHDTFSHTAFGQPWVNTEWLAQIILYVTYNLFGWQGLVLLCVILITATFILLYLLLVRELRATVALGASAISFLFISLHFLARPHLLTLPIIVVWTALLARASAENRIPNLWLLPLMTLWANLHGGFTLGLALTVGFGLDAVIATPSAERRHTAIQWIGFFLAALLASLVTPYGYLSIFETYHLLNLGEVLRNIGELRPMDPNLEFTQQVILLLLLAMALLFGVKIGVVRVLMVVVLLHFALQHVRGLAIFGLTLPLMIAHPLRRQFAFLRPTADPFPLFDKHSFRPVITRIAVATALALAVTVGGIYLTMWHAGGPPKYFTPAAALDHAMTADISGPVLNDYDFGGYLVFRGVPTFIDGRMLPFGKQFALEYFDAMKLGANDKLDKLADAYKVSWTLLRPRSPAALHFDRAPGWRRLYEDDVAVVHVRR